MIVSRIIALEERTMKLKELIEILQTLPQEKEVSIFWDGAARGDVDGIVNDDKEIVIVAEWSIYRDDPDYRKYPEEKIIYG